MSSKNSSLFSSDVYTLEQYIEKFTPPNAYCVFTFVDSTPCSLIVIDMYDMFNLPDTMDYD